ncbi:MAG: pilus assembly protein [Magnetospirillum sp.]|nr:pilus assembly protein [Magnetospirillum sp.]
MIATLRRLSRQRRGSAVLEFALVFPLIILLTVGAIEMGLMMLLDASLEIGIRAASRTGSITALGTREERENRIKAIVLEMVSRWVPGSSNVKIETKVYPALNNIGRPTWVDLNNNAICDDGEGTCPAEGGVQLVPGIGVSGSLVVYGVTVTRPGFSGIFKLIGINTLEFRRQAVVLNE